MKFTKLSLVAALAVSAAVAGGDIEAPVEPAAAPAPAVSDCGGCGKITGDARVWYGTSDRGAGISLFDKAGGFGDAAMRLDYTRSLLDGAVTLNAGVQGLSTLGLENELVSATWAGHGPNGVGDAFWIDTLNATLKLGNTAIIAGRQALDTPFFYTETWNIAKNTFDAIVVANNDLPDTTLVAAWVGRGNGSAGTVVTANNTDINGGMKPFKNPVTGVNHAAYALAAVTKLIPSTVAQAWYYKIPTVAQAYWLQADVNFDGIQFGAQYAGTLPSNILKTGAGFANTNAWAVKVGYATDALDAYAAYSQRNNANGIDISNIPTGHTAGSQSRLYTEAYWNYGFVGAQNARSFAVGGNYDLGMAKVGAQYTNVSKAAGKAGTDLSEFALTTSTKLGPVDVDLAYVYSKINKGNSFNQILVMTKLPFEL